MLTHESKYETNKTQYCNGVHSLFDRILANTDWICASSVCSIVFHINLFSIICNIFNNHIWHRILFLVERAKRKTYFILFNSFSYLRIFSLWLLLRHIKVWARTAYFIIHYTYRRSYLVLFVDSIDSGQNRFEAKTIIFIFLRSPSMMYQGLYGVFPFYVSQADICTFRDLKQSRQIQFVEHKTLDGLGRLQHTGRSLDPVSLNVLVAPMNQVYTVELRLAGLDAISRLGQELPLVIGLKWHGLYVLKSYDITRRQVHFGVTMGAEVALSLLEYN